jgi:ribosomal protein S18 acetylase RimI-like enzyme
MRVRNAVLDDAETIARFQLEMAIETEDKRLDSVIVDRGVLAVFGDVDRGRYVVAEMEGQVIGSLLLTWEWSDWRDGWFWWIQSVYVDPEHRRTGVFRKLYEHVVHQAEARPDVLGIRLYVENANTQAQAVYSSLGMRHSGYEVFELEFLT